MDICSTERKRKCSKRQPLERNHPEQKAAASSHPQTSRAAQHGTRATSTGHRVPYASLSRGLASDRQRQSCSSKCALVRHLHWCLPAGAHDMPAPVNSDTGEGSKRLVRLYRRDPREKAKSLTDFQSPLPRP